MSKVILGIDLSKTSTGWAAVRAEGKDMTILGMGQLKNDKPTISYGRYPECYLDMAKDVIDSVLTLVMNFQPDVIVIEETNSGAKAHSRYSQKTLEFLHKELLTRLRATRADGLANVFYLSSVTWRAACGMYMSKEDKKANAKLSKAKKASLDGKVDYKALGVRGKKTKKHVSLSYINAKFGLKLKMVQNDQAEALGLCWAWVEGAEHCDGI